MPIITWICEECQRKLEGTLHPPQGWLEISFWNGARFIRHAFCSYKCASLWAGKRYDEPSKEVLQNEV